MPRTLLRHEPISAVQVALASSTLALRFLPAQAPHCATPNVDPIRATAGKRAVSHRPASQSRLHPKRNCGRPAERPKTAYPALRPEHARPPWTAAAPHHRNRRQTQRTPRAPDARQLPANLYHVLDRVWAATQATASLNRRDQKKRLSVYWTSASRHAIRLDSLTLPPTRPAPPDSDTTPAPRTSTAQFPSTAAPY